MSTRDATNFEQKLQEISTTQQLNCQDRINIALQAIVGNISVTQVASNHQVSRKFVYQQKEKALLGLSQAFVNLDACPHDKVLYHIPVTKTWIEQTVLSLLLNCHASYSGVVEHCKDILDYDMCKSTVHNIFYKHLDTAKEINNSQDLSGVSVGLHDEIYQAGQPVLVGNCARSTFCYLLQAVESCDANSWGVCLLECQQKQNLNPDFTVIDGGAAARAGQRDAWPDTPAHGDTFHALKPFLEMVTYFENRALEVSKVVDDLKNKICSPRGKWKDEDNRMILYTRLLAAETAWEKAEALAEDTKTLYLWLKNDILSLTGPSHEIRVKLLTFIVEELSLREHMCPHKIKPIRTYLENHSDNLLAFVSVMEMYFYEISEEFEVPLYLVEEVYQLKKLPPSGMQRWEKQNALQKQLGHKFYWVQSMIEEVLKTIVRANSLVENLNSRLRTYFTLRREVGNEYLGFLQFFLNHRRFRRSECLERVGKSPAELLTGKAHKHWLQMLGFQLFKKAA